MLSECPSGAVVPATCGHSEDVGVRCQRRTGECTGLCREKREEGDCKERGGEGKDGKRERGSSCKYRMEGWRKGQRGLGEREKKGITAIHFF